MLPVACHAQAYETKSFDPFIHSVQIENYGYQPYYPIIELGSSDKVTLKFDDMCPDTRTLYYKVVHLNSDWTISQLSQSQYLDGFTGGFIQDYTTSINTYFQYNHYTLEFPNEDATPTVSGNYAIIVYTDNDDTKPLLTACFSVSESRIVVDASVSAQTDISYNNRYQQITFSLQYPDYNIDQPQTELTAVIQQNRRRDNEVRISQPAVYERGKVTYKFNKALIFDAGNDYRTFDISSQYILSRTVERIDYFKPYFHATLYPDMSRAKAQYDHVDDVSGRYIVNLQRSDDSDSEADYYYTHFTLETEMLLGYDIYILGELTGNTICDRGKMEYNHSRGCYEHTLLLKQGGYNYMYAVCPNGGTQGDLKPMEGAHWETDNEYIIYIYDHPFGSLYDKLIGYTIVYTNSFQK